MLWQSVRLSRTRTRTHYSFLSLSLLLVFVLALVVPWPAHAHPFFVPFYRKQSTQEQPQTTKGSSLTAKGGASTPFAHDRPQQQQPQQNVRAWNHDDCAKDPEIENDRAEVFEAHPSYLQRIFQRLPGMRVRLGRVGNRDPYPSSSLKQCVDNQPSDDSKQGGPKDVVDADDDEDALLFAQVGQSRPDQELTLRHVFHHGAGRYPGMFRRRDLTAKDLMVNEVLMGESLTRKVKVKTATTVRPRGEKFRSFKSQGFRALGRSLQRNEQSFAPETWKRELVEIPDVADKETIIQLSKMNYNSYTEVASPGWYDLEGHWDVNSTFGWEEDGVRGHVFTSQDNTTLIIAIKGTSAAFIGGGGGTAARDKINDNLLFSCCCAKVDRTWRGVCDCNTGGYQCDQTCLESSVNTDDGYYAIAMKILWEVQDTYPRANVWLTGHSLGGGLAALLGLTFGVPTVTFETPGDRLAAQRLHLPSPPALNWDEFPLFQVGHTADPIFQGVCNGPRSACYYSGFALESKCHSGRSCVYDPVGEDNWRVDIRTHRLADTIEGVLKVKDVPPCKQEVDCVDCALWEYI